MLVLAVNIGLLATKPEGLVNEVSEKNQVLSMSVVTSVMCEHSYGFWGK